MKKKKIINILFLFFSLFIQTIKADNNPKILPLTLNFPTKGSLEDNSYHFYNLTLNELRKFPILF